MHRQIAGRGTLAQRAAAAAPVLGAAKRAFIEHSTDPKKWRNTENEEIKRRFRESNLAEVRGERSLYRSHKPEEPESNERGGGSDGGAGTGAGVGVPLGSERIKQQGYERVLAEGDLADWNQVTYVSICVALLLVALNVLMDVVKPVPSPEYVPYAPATKGADGGPSAAEV